MIGLLFLAQLGMNAYTLDQLSFVHTVFGGKPSVHPNIW